MTPTAVGLVLVEGHEADGDIMDQDAFDVPTRRGATAISTSEYVAGALSRTRAIADGRRPHTIGVTWSDDSELEASLFLKSLTDAGFDNIVAVPSPEAGEALARGIGRAVGYQQTAVCLLEPETVVVSMVDTDDGTVKTVAHHEPASVESLIGWLTRVFDLNDWHPECLIVVGPDAGLDALTRRLEQALDIPVFAPAEVELALARGAALASTQSPEFTFGDYGRSPGGGDHARRRSWPLRYTAALTMLVVGILAFVVSIALVAGLRLTSDDGSSTTPTTRPPETSPPSAPAVAEAVPLPAAPPAIEVAPPPPVSAEPPSAIPPVEEQVSPPEEVPSDEPEEAPVVTAEPVVEAAPPPTDVPPPPEAAVPPAVPPVQESKPPLLTRILGRIPGLNRDPSPPAAPVVPPESPAPPP